MLATLSVPTYLVLALWPDNPLVPAGNGVPESRCVAGVTSDLGHKGIS